jgi:hypothetical protein
VKLKEPKIIFIIHGFVEFLLSGCIHHSWLCDVSKILSLHIADVEMLPSSIAKNSDNQGSRTRDPT